MQEIEAKSLLNRTRDGSWFGIEYNMNIYKGCCHGCIYCDSRSDCYQIKDFATVKKKQNALEILNRQLAKAVKTGVVGTGSMSDPYNPFEEEMKLSRNALELFNAYGFGVSIATKSTLITRDIDILKDIKEHSPVICKLTVTTADDKLAKLIEPHAPSSTQRFAALQQLHENGIFCGVLLMPVLPFINDSEENILEIIEKTAQTGANFIYPSFGMTLRSGQREYYYAELDKLFPDKAYAQKYRAKYQNRYFCPSPKAKKLWELFSTECQKHGILYKMPDIINGYKAGYGMKQLSFF